MDLYKHFLCEKPLCRRDHYERVIVCCLLGRASLWSLSHRSQVRARAISRVRSVRPQYYSTLRDVHIPTCTMGRILRGVLLACCFSIASFTDPGCVIELECRECVPDNMPLVTSHRAANGSVSAAAGDEVALSCGGGRFLLYPLLTVVTAVCEGGRYRARHDGQLRHLLDLGCQENVFEDVLHPVEHCSPPLQGRAYQVQAGGGTRHVALLCFDADRGVAAWAHATNTAHNALRLKPHSEHSAPLSLLGNFNHMFDAKTRSDALQLYADDTRMTRRLHELFKHDKVTFADQSLTSGQLLSARYFEDQNMRAADFVSNLVGTWRGVAAGNLRHTQRDVARLLRAAPAAGTIHVYSGTWGVLTLRAGSGRQPVYLRHGRFPIPKYMWTVVHDTRREKALAIVLLNDPLVAVSEIRDAVFCESECGRVGWLHHLRRHRNYESPALGLVFCCAVHNFTDIVTAMPKDALNHVPAGYSGMLLDIDTSNNRV